ncbi:MAG: ABC transporter substrate-binding protein [Candidatus Daviesbacteria bacterium]|nr:ABC transporter substrate-binding protein [Candidatus Daviesbacteria bacterium]
MNNKKILLSIVVLLILGLSAFFFFINFNKTPSPVNTKPAPSRISVAYISFNKMYGIPLIIAENTGLFNQYNLLVETKATDKSPTKLLVANQVNTILNTPFAPLTANTEGATLSWAGTIFNDSPIVLVSSKEPQNIKTVSYPAGGGVLGKTRTIQLLKALNLDPAKIVLNEVSSEQIAMTTLTEDKVDAAANITKSDWLIFKKKNNSENNKYKLLVYSVEKENLQISGGIIYSKDFLTDNKTTAENFSKALIEATAWTRLNKEKAIDILANKYSIEKDEAEIYWDEFVAVTNNVTFAPNLDQAETLLQIIKTTNPKAETYQASSFISTDINNSLKNSGYLEKFGFK